MMELQKLRRCACTSLAGLCVISACVKTVHSSAGAHDRSSYFAVILESIVSDTSIVAVRRALPLQFDPYPLRPDSDVSYVRPDTRASGADWEVQRRLAILNAMHLTVGSGEIPPDCAGTESPDTPDNPRHKGCPTVRRYVVAVARPRRADVTAPSSNAPAGRYWMSRVIVTAITPDGYNSQTRDYLLDSSLAGWTVLNVKRRAFLE